MHKKVFYRNLILLLSATILMIGCSDGERVAKVATEAADRQAQQNQEMAQLNREVAEGTKRMVEADAAARKEITAMHHGAQTEQAKVNAQRDLLEAERQVIAGQRRTESMLVPILQSCSVVALAVMLLGFCWYLLFGLRHHDQADQMLNELLVEEIVSESPAILPMALPAIERVALPADDQDRRRLTPD